MLENVPRSIGLLIVFDLILRFSNFYTSNYFYTSILMQTLFFISLFLMSFIITFNLKNNF